MSKHIQAPRGTYDVLPDQAVRPGGARAPIAREVLEAAGYERVETPTFEATELFARGVGASTDIVQKEMYTFEVGGRSYTLRPEGTAPVCRAYVEHGMHKLPQPVKLWYLSSFFRHERAQAGRYRQFWQVGVEALGSDDPALDAESIVLLHTLLDDLGTRDLRLRLASLGDPAGRAEYRGELQAYLRANVDRLAPEVRERIDLNPLRAFDSDDPSTREVMAGAPGCSTTSTTPTPPTLPRCAPCSTRPRSATRSTRRSCAASTTTRARCSSSPPTRSGRRAASGAAGATTGW